MEIPRKLWLNNTVLSTKSCCFSSNCLFWVVKAIFAIKPPIIIIAVR